MWLRDKHDEARGHSTGTYLILEILAVNHGNYTHFENRLVMGYTDCKYYVGLVETLKVISKCKPDPLSDTLQAGACIFPPPVPTCGSIWIVLFDIVFQVRPSTFRQRTGHLLGAISGSP